jgi:DNA modification methylase
MKTKLAGMVITDPPYNVKVQGHVGGKGKIKHKEFAMASGEMSSIEFTQFLKTTFDLLTKYSVQGSVHTIFMDWRHLPEIIEAGQSTYSAMLNMCVWVKNQAGMGSLYRSQHELALIYKNGTASHQNNVQLGRFGRYRTNVWQYCGIQSMRHGEEGDLLAMHPTVKPTQMIADAILDCSKRHDIILDPFLGSGTTLLACERVGRRCYGMELAPAYVDTAIRRWQITTGEEAIHAVTGQTFTAHSQLTQSTTPLECSHG